MTFFLVGGLLTVLLLFAKPSFSRLSFRNASRRLTQSAFVTMGLAASAMVFVGAQTIGDSLNYSLSNKVAVRFGEIGAVIAPKAGAVEAVEIDRLTGSLPEGAGIRGFIKALVQPVTVRAEGSDRIVVGVNLLGLEKADWLTTASQGDWLKVGQVQAGHILVTQETAQKLGVSAGDRIAFTIAGLRHERTVQAVIEDRGLVLGGAAVILPLEEAQVLLRQPGQVSHVFVVFPQGAVPGYMEVAGPVKELRSALASGEQVSAITELLSREAVKETIAAEAAKLNPKSLLAFAVMRLRTALDQQNRGEITSLLYEPELQFWLKGLSVPDAAQLATRLDQLTSYAVADVRNDETRSAQSQASQITTLLLVFGVFAIGSGIILIFLIISLLVQERVREIGILRAIGAKRRHVTLIMSVEGMLYSVFGAGVGVGLGVGISYLLIRWMVGATGVTVFHVEPGSILTALGGSLLLNGLTILFAAYTASGFRVAEATRGVIEAGERKRRLRELLGGVFATGIPLLLLGGCIYALGQASEWVSPVMVGLSLLFVGACQLVGSVCVRFGAQRERTLRAVYTIVGMGLVALWAIPTSAMQVLGISTYRSGLEVILLAGAMEVVGAICLVYQQGRLIFGLFVVPFRLVRRWLPIAHYAAVSASESPRVNARTVAMVSLISFVVVLVFTTTHAISGNKNYPDMWLRGYHLQLVAPGQSSVQGLLEKAPDLSDKIEAVGSRVNLPVLVRQADAEGGWVGYRITLGNAEYIKGAQRFGSKLFMRAPGYTDAAVWEALQSESGVAVITSDAVERRQNYNMNGVGGAFLLKGFFAESKELPAVTVEVRDLETDRVHTYRVIGVIASTGEDVGLFTSQKGWDLSSMAAAAGRGYFVRAKSLADVGPLQQAINRKLADQNVQAVNMLDAFYALWAKVDVENKVLGSFAGLGLFVGLAAIGVLSARAVVQRRQQIGVLRALGYKRSAVSSIFLIESSVLSLTGLLIGAIPALVLSFDVIRQMAKESPAFTFDPPIGILAAFLAGSFVMSFVVTVLASWQAASISPAEALRYE